MFKKITISILVCVLLLSACQKKETNQNENANRIFFALDTVISTEVYGIEPELSIDKFQLFINNMEDELSRTINSSIVYQLNYSNDVIEVNDDILKLISIANEYNKMTNGAFDITIASIADLWGFTKNEFRIPSDKEIEKTLNNVGMQHIHINNQTVQLDENTKIDFGGIAKGLALEQAYELYLKEGIEDGSCNLGGDALVFGQKGNRPWRIAIQNPNDPNNTNNSVGILNINDGYILTSGDYQRYFMHDGIRYPHIIDPKTGYPVNNELTSVTIVTKLEKGNGIMSDVLSTSLFIMGKDESIAFWKEYQDLFDMILITKDNQVLYTENIDNIFEKTNINNFDYHIIKAD